MEIRLRRTSFSEKRTLGTLSVDGLTLGTVIEPVSIEYAGPGDTCCIDEGEYIVQVVNNPNSGTPAIKVYGRFLPHNIAIRSVRPLIKKNASITFWNENDDEDNNISRWSNLLSILMDTEEPITLNIAS